MSTVGERLREAREGRGVTLEQVEAQLRIRRAFLAAMEEDRFQELPAGPYARGLIRSYATFLDLPTEELLADYRRQDGAPDVEVAIPTVLDEPLIVGASRRSIWPVAFLVLMVALALAVGTWYGYSRFYLHEDPLAVLKRLGIVPASFLSAPAGPGAPSSNETPPPSDETTPPPAIRTPGSLWGGAARQMSTPAPNSPTAPTATATLQGVLTPTPRRTATPTITPTPGAEPGEPLITGGVVVQASVTAPTWVSVTTDGTEILADTLQPGTQHTWQGNDSVSLRIGNAGGLELTVNGQPLGTLGASGEVIDRVFTREPGPSP